jgi:Kdo2-lipid IVA lauroyltransferase/acyltransferase
MTKTEKTSLRALTLVLKSLGLIPQNRAKQLSSIIGRILYTLDKRHRTIALDNLAMVFGDEKSASEIKMIAKDVFENISMMIFEIAWSLSLREKDFFRYFSLKNVSNFKNACQKNKGVLLLSAHVGNWELLTVSFATLNHPVNPIYRPLDNLILDQLVLNIRERFGSKLIPKARSMQKILKCLKQGHAVGLGIDQNVDWYEGVFVDFMGTPACTSRGTALLAMKSGAPVVPVFMIHEKGKFTAEFGPEVPLIKTGDKTKDIEENTRQYNAVIGNFVRRYPNRWFWVHQRWKTKPYQPWPGKTSEPDKCR